MEGLRQTKQREAILDFLRKVKSHPTADLIFKGLRPDMPSMTLATVYRNLNVLNRIGIISRFELDGECRYDGDTGLHQHFICKSCRQIIDMKMDFDQNILLKKANSYDGFRVDSMDIKFFGICKSCKSHVVDRVKISRDVVK